MLDGQRGQFKIYLLSGHEGFFVVLFFLSLVFLLRSNTEREG